MAESVDLSFIATRLDRLTTEVGSLRDDMTVLTSIALRLDGTVNAVLAELRATHQQVARMNDRVRKLEDAGPSA